MKLTVFAAGEFGRAVATSLAGVVEVVEHPLVASHGHYDRLIEGADFVVSTSWRPYDSLAEEIGSACARARLPWSSAWLSDQYLFCGPVVVPPCRPCYRCLRRRLLVHDAAGDRERAVRRAFEADHALGVEGFLPPAAALAAAALCEDARSPIAGRVRRVDLLTCDLVETRVVPIHGCQICGQAVEEDTTHRFVRALVAALRDLRC